MLTIQIKGRNTLLWPLSSCLILPRNFYTTLHNKLKLAQRKGLPTTLQERENYLSFRSRLMILDSLRACFLSLQIHVNTAGCLRCIYNLKLCPIHSSVSFIQQGWYHLNINPEKANYRIRWGIAFCTYFGQLIIRFNSQYLIQVFYSFLELVLMLICGGTAQESWKFTKIKVIFLNIWHSDYDTFFKGKNLECNCAN